MTEAKQIIAREYQYTPGVQKSEYKVVIKSRKANPSLPKGKFIKVKAVKFNRNGSVTIKK